MGGWTISRKPATWMVSSPYNNCHHRASEATAPQANEALPNVNYGLSRLPAYFIPGVYS